MLGASSVERAYGGDNATIDTPAEELKLVNSFTSQADTNAKLAELPAAEAKRIYQEAMTPAYSVDESGTIHTEPADDAATAATSHATRHVPAPVRRAAAKAKANATAKTRHNTVHMAVVRNKYGTYVCRQYSGVGVHLFNYNSNWWCKYGGVEVKDAGHHEYSDYQAPSSTTRARRVSTRSAASAEVLRQAHDGALQGVGQRWRFLRGREQVPEDGGHRLRLRARLLAGHGTPGAHHPVRGADGRVHHHRRGADRLMPACQPARRRRAGRAAPL